jgi:hypothetical protein
MIGSSECKTPASMRPTFTSGFSDNLLARIIRIFEVQAEAYSPGSDRQSGGTTA